MFPDLKNELENNILLSPPSYIDSSARRTKGKVFFRNRELHDFSCFDVLGLSQNQRVKRSAQECIEISGVSNCASRKNAGTSSEHLICEKSLASFFGYERALLFSGKNQTVMSLLATLLREQDLVYCDEDYAGLLTDVCLLLNCPLEIVALDKLKKLEEMFDVPTPGRRRFVFADSIGSSSARKLDLLALSLLCKKHNVILIVDESYAAGIIGSRGAGVLDECDFGVSPVRPYCLISELGFGLGSFGSCLCGPGHLIDALAVRSRTLAVEPSFPAQLAASINTAIDVCELSLAPRALVKGKIEYLYAGLIKIKQRIEITQSSFISMRFEKSKEASKALEFLFSKGFLAELLPSPSRFSEAAFLRIIPNCFHTDEVMNDLLAVLDDFFVPKRK